MDIAGAAASGQDFLGWKGSGRRVRVMYLDGEMPAETAKERLAIIAQRYGEDLDLWFYNRDILKDGDMPPLNKEDGEKWLLAEIEAVKPDLIIFDNIMSLLVGSMSDPESWAPIILLMRKLTSMRIAQAWIHHTGHDESRSYGDKTREWQMDTVLRLLASKDGEAVTLDFTKSRLKTPKTKDLYRPRLIACGPDGCEVIGEAAPAKKGKQQSDVENIMAAILAAYDRLSDGVDPSTGFAGETVRKVKVDALREAVRDRGFLDTKESGGVTDKGRQGFHRAKASLIAKRVLIESGGLVWRLYGKTDNTCAQ
jgi:RecA-family ATPase